MSLTSGARSAPQIDGDLCRACGRCVARSVCRTKAIRTIDPDEPPYIDLHLCLACYECVPACPSGAILRPTVTLAQV